MELTPNIRFINYGDFKSSDYVRKSVHIDNSIEVFEKVKASLPPGHYISLNETYVSFDGFIEQGDCIRYETT